MLRYEQTALQECSNTRPENMDNLSVTVNIDLEVKKD